MKLVLTILGIFLCHIVSAQYDKVWIYGQSSGGRTGVLGGLDFNTKPPTPFPFPMERVGNVNIFGETTASISDEEGHLLFATDGYHIWTREGKLMPNGRGVNFKSIDTTESYVGSASQGCLIVKVPCEEYLYYVFAVGQMELGASFGDLYYSLVDMRLNNGMGDVVADKKSILLNRAYSEHMTIVQGKGNYLWLLVIKRRGRGGTLHAYKINVRGIDEMPVESIMGEGSVPTVGWLVGNNKSDKLALADYFGNRISVMDFNNEIGEVVSSQRIRGGRGGAYGVCFSPNDSLLYVSDGNITQYELYNNHAAHLIKENSRFSAIQKGPDDKLYFLSEGNSVGLHAINFPNRVGSACGLELNAVEYTPYPVFLHGGLPNTIGVFKSEKRVTTVAHHTIEQLACGKNITLYSADTIPDKTTLWNTGTIGDSIAVNKSGIYAASTFSTSVCWEHIDSYFVYIPEPKVELDVLSTCPNADNGRIKVVISNVEAHYIQNITWYNTQRDQILGYGDSLVNIGGGKYWVRISFTGCDTMLEVVVPRLEDRVSFTADSLICVATQLDVKNTSGEGYSSFGWYYNDSLFSTKTDMSVVPNDTGLAQLTLIGEMEHCRDTLTKFIQIDPRLVVKFDLSPKEICVGEKIDIQADNHHTIESYVWNIGKHKFTNQSPTYTIAMDESGEYQIKLITAFRICPDTTYQLNVKVHANPEVYLGDDSSICYQGNMIKLQNRINQPTNTNSYLWSTGDTSQSIQVRAPGLYSLTERSEPIGCTGYGSIEISKDCFADIPNAFTPNGDGINDYFFPRKWLTNGVEKFHLQIFNRWGNLLFETKNIDGLGWDGQWNGQLQPIGVYLYRITLVFKNGAQESYEGNVTLLH